MQGAYRCGCGAGVVLEAECLPLNVAWRTRATGLLFGQPEGWILDTKGLYERQWLKWWDEHTNNIWIVIRDLWGVAF